MIFPCCCLASTDLWACEVFVGYTVHRCESVTEPPREVSGRRQQDTAGDSRELRPSRGASQWKPSSEPGDLFGEAESAETPRPREETRPGGRAVCAAVTRHSPSRCLSDASSGKPELLRPAAGFAVCARGPSHFSAHERTRGRCGRPRPPEKTRTETPPPADGTLPCTCDHPVRASCPLFPGGLLRPRCSGSNVLQLLTGPQPASAASLSSYDDRLGEVLSEYFTFTRSQARQACHAEVRVGLLSPNLRDGGR
ncbi:uncharacterized protein LOC116582569 [Mustela erminea]|uniref:uncharacterized protein LOC116582569 n=1 Tax=Mustela erminea TaxID=36723 RepID=UPI0013872955|nr:uncharacterized protein LOC116582569 [Mustela erminea]